MGLFSKWFYGVDVDAEEKRKAALDEWQAKLDAEPRMETVWSPQDRMQHELQLQAEAADFEAGSLEKQVDQAFVTGAKEGLAAEAAAVRGTVNTVAGKVLPETIKTILAFLPWWVWLSAALYGAWRIGLLQSVGLWGGRKGIEWLRSK